MPGSGWYRTDPATGIMNRLNPFPARGANAKAPYSFLETPVKGAWVPFSSGVRKCTGQRFATVEMVALIAKLFGDGKYKVEIAREAGETGEQAIERGWGYMRESTETETMMLRRNDVRMVWVAR